MVGTTQKKRRSRANPLGWLTREFSRIRLTVWLLIIMAVTMIVGSIFPQGYGPETYISSWGEARYLLYAKLGLLNLFHSKYFLTLGVLLLLNLVICSILRLSGRRTSGPAGGPPDHARKIRVASGAAGGVRKVLTGRGYKTLSDTGGTVTARRGPWPEGVSLLYHIAMGIAIVGFLISAMFSFEGDVTLWPGEPVEVATVSAGTGAVQFGNTLADCSIGSWHPFAGARTDTTAWDERKISIALDEFVTEWEFHNDKYYPKDWLSHLTATCEDGVTRSVMVEVNRPLRVSGLTFYQMAYEQTFDVVVFQDGEEIERIAAESYAPFTLESIPGTFSSGTLRVGTLFEKYRDPIPVVPHTPLKWTPPEPAEAEPVAAEGGDAETELPSPTEQVKLGDLSLETPIVMSDIEQYAAMTSEDKTEANTDEMPGELALMLDNPYEASILTYRHDPGVSMLYVSVTLFLLGLMIRTYWPSYRVQLWLSDGEDAHLVFRATGMLGEPEDVEQELVDALEE
ncbi:cytochrome c biogenesis protein ResB [bacterium]|nr:cytochrome c biogenesis protein ResB [bacterium]